MPPQKKSLASSTSAARLQSSNSTSANTSRSSTPPTAFNKSSSPLQSSVSQSGIDFTIQSSSSKRSRKFTAIKAPSSDSHPNRAHPYRSSSFPHSNHSKPSASTSSIISIVSPSYPASLRSLVLSLTNDRYPGAPGTALYKAREANEREIARQKREKKKLEQRKEELQRLGIDINGAVVSTTSTPSASTSASSASGPSSSTGNGGGKRARRSTPTIAANGNTNASNGTSHGKKAAGSRKTPNLNNSLDPDALPHPAAEQQLQPSAVSSRTRKPASRGSSPVPITSAAASNQSGSNGQLENGGGGSSSKTAGRGSSPDTSKTISSPSSSQPSSTATSHPYQSSPLARDVTSASSGTPTEEKTVELGGTRPLKRKASALVNEITYKDENDFEKPNEKGDDEKWHETEEVKGSPKKKVNKGNENGDNGTSNRTSPNPNHSHEIQPPLPANHHHSHTGNRTSPSPLLRAAIHSSPLAQSVSEFSSPNDQSPTGHGHGQGHFNHNQNLIDPVVVIEPENGELEASEVDLIENSGYGSDVSNSANTKDSLVSTSGRKRVPPKRLEEFHQPVSRRSVSRNTASPAPANTSSNSSGIGNEGLMSSNGSGNEMNRQGHELGVQA